MKTAREIIQEELAKTEKEIKKLNEKEKKLRKLCIRIDNLEYNSNNMNLSLSFLEEFGKDSELANSEKFKEAFKEWNIMKLVEASEGKLRTFKNLEDKDVETILLWMNSKSLIFNDCEFIEWEKRIRKIQFLWDIKGWIIPFTIVHEENV